MTRNLQEVVLAVHLAEPLPITVRDLAAWIAEYGGEEGSFQELPTLGQAELPVPGQPAATVGIHLVTDDKVVLPRIRVSGADKHTVYVFQNDRVAFGWQRDMAIGEEADYPGYEALREKWADEVGRFAGWLASRISQPLLPRLVELSYNNAYPLVVEGRRRRMGEIFKLLDPDYRPVNAFHISWSEFVGTSGDAIVSAQAGIGSAPPGQRVFAVNYFGLAAVTAPTSPHDTTGLVMQGADKLHERIGDMHRAAIISGA